MGRPVTGEITTPEKDRVKQKTGDEFLPLLDAVLAIENVEKVRWTQYTPYFNDGEVCSFGLYEIQVKMVGEDIAGYDDDGYISTYEMTEFRRYETPTHIVKPQFTEVHPALKTLNDQIKHFEDFLLVSFGDPAEVTATRDGFHVDFYDHE
jgi:hypothetical protein